MPLFNRVSPGSVTTDVLPISDPPRDALSRPLARIRRAGAGETAVHDLHLIAVDHAGDGEVFERAGGFLVGSREPAAALHHLDGANATDLLAGNAERCLVGDTGDVVDLTLASAAGGPLYLTARGTGYGLNGSSAEIEVQVRDAQGAWVEHARWAPPSDFVDGVFDGVGGSEVRLRFHGNCAIKAAGRVLVSDPSPVVHRLEPATAHLTSIGTIDTSRFAPVGPGATVGNGDTLLLAFDEPAPTSPARQWYLEATGWTSGGGVFAGRAKPSSPGDDAAATRMALWPPEPNPSRGSTRLRFTLPTRSGVAMSVHDIAGRRVRRLVAKSFEPGTHALEWDGRDDEGRPLPAGVYLVRFTAGARRLETKLVRQR